jgi:HAD superfamily hydrolase (TIGR01662 family)
VFEHFRPGFDLAIERARREQAGLPEHFDARDLYPDARPCLDTLNAQGYLVGLAGNQTARAERLLRELRLPVDFIGTSAGWGVEKPSPGFFEKIISECGYQPAEIVYVGDRLDNDVRPALAAGLVAVRIRRGPWGLLQADDARSHTCLVTLQELPDLLRTFHRVPDQS